MTILWFPQLLGVLLTVIALYRCVYREGNKSWFPKDARSLVIGSIVNFAIITSASDSLILRITASFSIIAASFLLGIAFYANSIEGFPEDQPCKN